MRITSAGLVGIGTSSPGESIHTTGKLRVGDGGNYTVAAVQLGASNANGISYPGTNILNFITNSTAALTIDASQRVGIGVTGPQYKLAVFGTADNEEIIHVGNTAGTTDGTATNQLRFTCNGSGAWANARYNAYSHRWGFGGNASVDEAARIDSSGRLLVGTSTNDSYFGSKFQIAAGNGEASSLLTRFSANASGPVIFFGKSRSATVGTKSLVSDGDTLGGLEFYGSGAANWQLGAKIEAQVDGTPESGGDTSDMPGRLVFSTTADGASSPTERMRISNGGYASFNTTSVIGSSRVSIAQDFVTGNGLGLKNTGVQTGGQYFVNTSSDYRLKENVTPVSDGITRLQQLKPSRFNFIADPAKTVDGFLAHEVQTIVPEAITGEKDAVDDDGNPEYQGIDQSKLVPLLTAALQEAIAKIEVLEQRLNDAGIN
jgi:hypothetical protein